MSNFGKQMPHSRPVQKQRNLRTADCIHVLTQDIDTDAELNAKQFDLFIDRCVNEATNALNQTHSSFGERDRGHLRLIAEGMRVTHGSIRTLLKGETPKPSCIDALPLARVQLETLYSVCLICDRPEFMGCYLKYVWKKQFLNYLVDCENTKNLPRLSASLSELLPAMKELQLRAGVSDNERKTLECEALGLHLPKDVEPARIANFPTPGKVIPNVRIGSKQKMLKCLYPEYQYLSSSVHGSSQFAIYKVCFGDRGVYKGLFTSAHRETLFARVAEPALIIDYLSIIQTCTELSTLYPNNYSLREALIVSWNYILNKALLGAIIWETRTRQLLGVIEKAAPAGVQFS